jgi:1-acyl-sn-glycerol-3-phosphate acyltransferase
VNEQDEGDAPDRPDEPGATGAPDQADSGDPRDAPWRHAPFVIDTRWTVGYRMAHWFVWRLVLIWFRPTVVGRDRVPESGPVVLAPVHRSIVDFLFSVVVTDRKLFFMAKDSLWRSRLLAKVLPTVGVFPVHREGTDREALRRAEEVLHLGQLLVMFPEGTRQAGSQVQPLRDGVAFLAARTGAVVVPVGLGGSDRSMPKGARFPKPVRVAVVVGEPVPPAPRTEGGRVPRSAIRRATDSLQAAIQIAYDQARDLAAQRSRRQVENTTLA